MNKAYLIIVLVVVGAILLGLFLGFSKLADLVNRVFYPDSSNSATNDKTSEEGQHITWYAANLPGAEQVYFYTFNNGEVNVPGVSYEGDCYNSSDRFEAKNGGNVVLSPTLDDTYIPADVFVFDFDVSHPMGTPATSFDNNIVQFSNRYYTDFSESGGVGDPVNTFCLNAENDFGNASYDKALVNFGNDFTKSVHVTVLMFSDKTVYYVNGTYLYEDNNVNPYVSIYLNSLAISPNLADPVELDYGCATIDNLECVRFGDGTGSYNGILMSYKTNTSLKISDLLEVK